MPMLTTQVEVMDEARLEFIDKLNKHCVQLREELRISELVLHSVVKSVSNKSEQMQLFDDALTKVRREMARHAPHVEQHDASVEQQIAYAVRQVSRDRHVDDDQGKQQAGAPALADGRR